MATRLIGAITLMAVGATGVVAQQKDKQGGGKGGGGGAVTGITVALGGAGPVVSWQPVSGATYSVARWKIDDPQCCNATSSPSQPLTATSWQDAAPPASGTYVYRVTATAGGKVVTGETQFAYQKPASTSTGTTTVTATATPIALDPIRVTSPTIMTGTLMTAAPASGRYRVTLNGFRTGRETYDDMLERDGKRDEVYGSAVAVLWDRSLNQYRGVRFARTREYGDVGSPVVFPERIRAGTASPAGGIWGGTGGDIAPIDYNPSGTPTRGPVSDQFPLLVWEGTLTDGVEALVVAPSLWERDADPTPFKNYQTTWNNGAASAMALISSTISAQQGSTSLVATVAPIDPAQVAASAVSNMFLLAIPGSFHVMASILSGSPDRPIGLSGIVGGATWYQERLVVITREKLASLAAGGATVLPVPVNDSPDPQLGGQYTLFLRIERLP